MISVVIPTYNEAENIEELIREISGQLSDREREVIVVDDNSPDGTAGIVKNLSPEINSLEVVERGGKQGIGSAYREGFRHASGDIVVQMDADFSHRPEDMLRLVETVEEGLDIAIGSRFVEGGDRNDPLLRRINPWIGRFLYRYLLGCPVNDFTSGFKAYDREVAEELANSDLPDGFQFQAASLMKLVEEGRSFKEVPITFRQRRAGNPKYSTGDLIDNVKLLARFTLDCYEQLIKFSLVGASGVLVNMGLLYFLTEHFGLYYILSAAIAVEASILSNFAFNEIWTFVERGKEGIRNVFNRFLKFNSISLIGLGINISILWALTELAGLHYLVSNLFAISLVFAWNYLANTSWTWTD